MVLRESNDPLNQSRGIMGPLENAAGVQNNRGRLRQRFDLIRKLGQGTYGKVQLGIDKETGQEVAIKTIKKSKIETEADLIRIRREIQIMSSVRHPNIIHIYEVFENREKMVLVMEYAAGGELYDYLNERKVLQDDEARRIFRQIASAVYYCHKHKICHRDLKLENILLDEKFNAKIADFGLSNVFDEVNLLKTFCGSPLYASPEIVRGTPYKGPEVDCWSLGVLLYTLVYGAMPFDGSNFKRLVKQISHGDYYEPKKPAEASPLIRIMLTVDPKKRADIRKVCNHPWVNQGSEKDCLAAADELATQTPVRLDLLLALANCSAISHNQVVVDQPTQPNATPSQPAQPGKTTDGKEVKQDGGATNDVGDQHAPKKPKRTKIQSKSKSSPMLELIHDADEELELPAGGTGERGPEEEDLCDTLSEISEIQTLAEDVAAENGASTSADIASKTKAVVKKDPSKVKEVPKKAPVPAPAATVPTESVAAAATPPMPTPAQIDKKVKKTEPEPQPVKPAIEVKSVKKEAPAPAASAPVPTEDDKKKKPVAAKVARPVEADKPKSETKKEVAEAASAQQTATQEQPKPTPTPTTAKAKEEAVKAKEDAAKDSKETTAPSSREVTPAPTAKEKSATPPDKDSGESGEEGKVKAKLKDRADSVSPTRIERRNSKVISQKTAELIQNLETKVSPSGTSSSMEPPPKPPGIKKIVIPNFKVSDAKSKFESKPPRPLTTSVSRSKAAFEAKLQSQTSVEEKSPPKTTPTPTKGESPPTETAKPAAKPPVEVTAATDKPKEEPAKTEKPKPQEAVKKPVTAPTPETAKPEPAKAQPEPVPTAAPKPVTPKVPPGKIQTATATTTEKPTVAPAAASTPATPSTTSEVKPVLMDSGTGTPKKAVMVVKGKASSPATNVKSPASPSPQLETPAQVQTSICVASDDHPSNSNSTTNIACNDMGTRVAPTESCTEGETGKTGATPPTPLGPAAAAKQKLLSKLPPAPTPPAPAAAAAPLQSAQNGSSKELAVKNITSAISKIVNSGSASKGLNTEEGPKKFSTLPRAAKPESEKIVKTEVCFPVSAPEIPVQQPAPVKEPAAQKVAPSPQQPQPQQQPKQERIIPIKFVDESVNSPSTPTAAATPSATPSASVTSVASRASTTPGTPLISHRDSTSSLFSRQNSSDAESCSVATQPHKFEPIKKCPREFLIPIKLEDSGQTVTPKEELTSGDSNLDVSQAGGEDDFRIDSRLRSGRFARPKRYSSLLSDSSFDDEPSISAAGSKAPSRRASATAAPSASTPSTAGHTRSRSQGDEPTTPGGTFKRYRNRRHNTAAPDMPLDRSDSFSSAEEDEEDAFQVLTAESLFSNLLDRVRNLTRRINRDDPMMTPNWSTDPATFGLWGASPLREFMTSRAPSETRSFTNRRESSVSMNSSGGQGGAWRRSLSRDLSGESGSESHSASINTTNARSQLGSRLSSDLYETSSSRSLPLSTRRSPSYLSHRSVDNDLGSGFGSASRTYSRTLSHSGGDYNGTSASGSISRTLPLRRSLKTFDRGPQHVISEYDTTASGMMRHSLLDSKYDMPSNYLTRFRSQSRDRQGDREGSVMRMRTLYPSSGEANGWEGGPDATSSSIAASTTSSSSSYGTLSGGGIGSHSISPISTAVSLDSESMFSGNTPFQFPTHDNSPSRLLSVQEKMNNYSQYYQSLTQRSPFRRLPLASPSQIHANGSGSGSSFGVGLSEIKNLQSPISSSSPSAFSRPTGFTPVNGATTALKIDPTLPETGMISSNSDEGSATPFIQSPVSNPVSSLTSPSISPPQIPSPIPSSLKPTEVMQKPSEEEYKNNASKPPTASSSIPRWPAVSVRQHRPLSISSFPDGPRASSVSRVMSPPPIKPESGTISKDTMTNGYVEPAQPAAVIALQKRRDSRATSVERITRLLERKSMPREAVPSTTAAVTDSTKKKASAEESTSTTNGEVKATDAEKGTTSKKPKFLQNLEKKWEKLTHSGSTSNSKLEQEVEPVASTTTATTESKDVPVTSNSLPNNRGSSGSNTILSTPASPEPFQAGGTTSEDSSSHEDKINESVLLRRALSPEKKVKATSRLGGTSSGGTVNFMLGKFKKLESTQDSNPPNGSNLTGSRIPTGRPMGSSAAPLASRFGSSVGRRVQMPYAGTTSDSVLTLTASFAKETGRSAETSSVEETGIIKNAAAAVQEKRRAMHGNLDVKKDMPTNQEGPSPPVETIVTTATPVSPPQIQIHDSNDQSKVSNETLPQLDMLSLSPISVSSDTRTESDEGSGAPTKSNSGSAIASDEPESVSDRILRKSFYNRFNASGIDRNRRSHSVTPGTTRRAAAATSASPNNNLRVNTSHSTKSSGSGGGGGSSSLSPHRLPNSPSSSTVASAESKDSTTGSEQSGSHNRSTSPYLSGLNKYNPNPLFKELMLNEDYRTKDVCKKTEYSRKITSKLSKLLREIESDLNSCQLTKTESDDGDSTGLLYCAGRFPQEVDASEKAQSGGGGQGQQQQQQHTRPNSVNRGTRAGSALPIPNTNGNM